MVDLNDNDDPRISVANVDGRLRKAPRVAQPFAGASLADEEEKKEIISNPLRLLLAMDSFAREDKDRKTSIDMSNLYLILETYLRAQDQDQDGLMDVFEQSLKDAPVPDADEFVNSLSDPNNTSSAAVYYRSSIGSGASGLSLNGNISTRYDGSAISAIHVILGKEGLFSNHAADNGGATMMGIASRSWPRDYANIMRISQTQGNDAARAYAIDFYERNFWNPVDRMVEQKFGNLSEEQQQALKFVAFDAAVNGGMGLANRLLNRSGGNVEAFMDARLSHLQSLDDWGTFGRGWTNRVNSIGSQAMSFMNGNHSPALARRHDNDDDHLPVRVASRTPTADNDRPMLGLGIRVFGYHI